MSLAFVCSNTFLFCDGRILGIGGITPSMHIPVPKSPGDVSWKGLIQEMSPGLNLEKIARVSKNLRKFSLSEWQFIGSMTKHRNVFFRPAETAGFGPWHRDILIIIGILNLWAI
jgi:hypothetical protein